MITRTLTQIKVFDVKAHSDEIGGHGWSHLIPRFELGEWSSVGK